MDIERSTQMQVAVGFVSVAVFVALVLFVGGRNGGDALQPEGGLTLVGILVFFVVLMTVLGLALSDQLSDE